MIDISSGFHQGSATPVNQAKVGTISLKGLVHDNAHV